MNGREQLHRAGLRVPASVVVVVVMSACAVAMADTSLPVCLLDDSQHDGESVSSPEPERQRIERVSPSDLPDLMPGRLLVDVRPSSLSERYPVEGALTMSLLGLRALLHASDREVLIVGVGDDDDRLAYRIAGWPEADRVRVISGGAPAVRLSDDKRLDDQTLMLLLDLTPARAVAAAMSKEVLVLAAAESGIESLLRPVLLPSYIALDDPTAASAIQSWLKDSKIEDQGGFLLVDQSGQQAQQLSLELSRALKKPVFHVNGGLSAIDEFTRRYADMNRQPGRLIVGCY